MSRKERFLYMAAEGINRPTIGALLGMTTGDDSKRSLSERLQSALAGRYKIVRPIGEGGMAIPLAWNQQGDIYFLRNPFEGSGHTRIAKISQHGGQP